MEQSDLYLLQAVPPYHLQAIVKNRSATQTTPSKIDASLADVNELNIAEVADYLFEPRACRETLRKLSEIEVSILRTLISCGGRANSRDLALYLEFAGAAFAPSQVAPREKSSPVPAAPVLSTQPGMLPSLYPTPHPHGVFEQAVHHLLLLGLLFWGKQTNFVGRDYANGVYDGVLIVPQAIASIARQEWYLDEELQARPFAPVEAPGEGMQVLQRMLYLYWSLVATARDGLPMVNSHLLSRTALRHVMESLSPHVKMLRDLTLDHSRSEMDIPYLLFLRLLLMQLGLLVERQGALHAAPAQDFFALPLGERAWHCFRLWLETPFWNEMAFLSDVNVQPGPAPLDPAHEEAVHARQIVVEYVLQMAQQEWHAIPTFIARMKLFVPYLLFPRQFGSRSERYSVGSNPYGWNFRLRRGWLTHREGWHQVEGGFIRVLLNGPLYWLGAIELNEEEHPNAFHLAQEVGLLLTTDAPDIKDPPWGRLIVQPNFDLVALAPVSESLLVELDRFAERVRLEHIAQYRLTKASVTRAVQAGLDAETIQRLLESAAGGSVPQNVQYSLVEWERQVRRVELWRGATLLEVDDPALLDELCADVGAQTWILHRLSPTLAEVATAQLARVQDFLWQRDYLPALSSAAQHQELLGGSALPTREVQWELLPDGLLRPLYPVTHMYLAIELERFTIQDETTGWRRIVPTALQQALATGISLTQIIHFLQHYCSGGVPGSFLIRLKLWGSGYADATAIHVERTPLVSLPHQMLQDVLADEEIGPLLSEAIPADQRLVRIDPRNLERVVAYLKDRGFDVLL